MPAGRWVSHSPTWMCGTISTTVSGNSSKMVDTELLFFECSCTYTLHMHGSTYVCECSCTCKHVGVEVKGHSPVLFFKRHPPWVSFVVLCFWRLRRGVLLVCTLPSRLYYPAGEPQKFSCPCPFSAGITCVYHHTLLYCMDSRVRLMSSCLHVHFTTWAVFPDLKSCQVLTIKENKCVIPSLYNMHMAWFRQSIFKDVDR